MPQTSWDDYRIAYHVADSGTLSKAGKIMNMNHATVLRHINRLEEALETKLFIRHQRGYQLTDAGELMIKELPNIKKSFIRLENLISSMEKDISGSLRITTVSDYSAMLNPALKEFRTAYPKLRIHIIATDVVLSLAEGSAHVSLRVGSRPGEPDLIVKKLKAPGVYFCASDDYLEQYGIPKDTSDYKNHLWALPSEEKRHIPFVQKILKHISEEQIIYQSNSFQDIHNAVIEGMAIGPMNGYLLEQNKHLNQLDIPIQQEDEGLWFVYHKDLKNSVRIKTLYDFLVKSLE